jgi:hypothetical protein
MAGRKASSRPAIPPDATWFQTPPFLLSAFPVAVFLSVRRFPDIEFDGLLGITIRLGVDASARLMQGPAREVINE